MQTTQKPMCLSVHQKNKLLIEKLNKYLKRMNDKNYYKKIF